MARNSAAPEVVTTICAESVSKRKLPVNLNHDDLALFNHELERTIPHVQLLKFHDVRVSADGLLFNGARILPESFAFPDHLEQWKLRSVFKFLVTNYFLRRRRQIDGEVLWITDYWSNAYFHWMTDALTRLFVVRDRLDDLMLMLPAGFENFEFVKSSLKAFEVKRVEFIQAAEVLHCRNLLMPTHTAPSGHYNEELIRGVRSVLLSAYGETTQDERIYVSRQRASKRKIVNEDVVSVVLRKFGFQIVCAEELSFEQQVRMFSRARYVVSNHGAGLTNILFMKEGGSVLELRHHSDRINNCYFTLSSALNLNYFYQTCQTTNDARDPHTADLLVDLEELEKTLTGFL
jgi:capsular polysaccharide biosynthesis protein